MRLGSLCHPSRFALFAAMAAGIAFSLSANADASGGGSLGLVVTAAVDNGDPAQCGVASDVDVLRGQLVNLCYTVTNTGGTTLNFHTVTDADAGRVLVHQPHPLAPGDTYRFNRLVAAGQSDTTYTAQWLASDILPGFDAVAADYDFIDISTTGTPDYSLTFDLPFPILFLDDTDTQTACLVNTGALQFFAGQQGPFGICGIWTMHDNTLMPVDFLDGSASNSLDLDNRYPISWMPVFWDYLSDFFLGTDGGLMYQQTLGTAPNRRFVAEWKGFHHIDEHGDFSDGDVTFEAILEEETGRIAFQYQDTTFGDPANPGWDHGGTATAGYQYGMDLFGAYIDDEALLGDGTAIAWTPNSAQIVRSSEASATIHPGYARVEASPPEVDLHADPGATASAPITIRNSGTLDLDWSIDEATAGVDKTRRPQPAWIPDHVASPASASIAVPPWASLRHFTNLSARGSGSLGTAPAAYAMSGINTESGPDYTYKLMPDVADPASTFDIADTGGISWIAAGFVANDFSREYAITYADGRLQTIDTANASVEDIAPISGAPQVAQWQSLKWDPTTNNVYILGLDSLGAGYLFTLDIGNGNATLVGPIVCDVAANTIFVDIAIGPDGSMYGIDVEYDGLFAIAKETGAATPIGPLGFDSNYVQGMDFDHASGVIYLTGYDDLGGGGLYTIDPHTGAATFMAPLPGLANFWGFALASYKGGCATPESVPWLSVTPPAGNTEAGASSIATLTLDAGALVPGAYDATLCVRSNDTSDPGVMVRVRFAVGLDEIFADGFDG